MLTGVLWFRKKQTASYSSWIEAGMNQEQVIEMFDVLILCQTNTLIYIWGFFFCQHSTSLFSPFWIRPLCILRILVKQTAPNDVPVDRWGVYTYTSVVLVCFWHVVLLERLAGHYSSTTVRQTVVNVISFLCVFDVHQHSVDTISQYEEKINRYQRNTDSSGRIQGIILIRQ